MGLPGHASNPAYDPAATHRWGPTMRHMGKVARAATGSAVASASGEPTSTASSRKAPPSPPTLKHRRSRPPRLVSCSPRRSNAPSGCSAAAAPLGAPSSLKLCRTSVTPSPPRWTRSGTVQANPPLTTRRRPVEIVGHVHGLTTMARSTTNRTITTSPSTASSGKPGAIWASPHKANASPGSIASRARAGPGGGQ
jgi:hypothetical protein